MDVGNTHTHLGLADAQTVYRQWHFPTQVWADGGVPSKLPGPRLPSSLAGAVLACVVPKALPGVRRLIEDTLGIQVLELNAQTLRGLQIDYPRPGTIGPDRLANALAARVHWGTPVLAVDAGTATTFDVVNRQGQFIGGAIAPGFSLVSSCLTGKTALLPRMKRREMDRVIGRNTQEALLAGAICGYCGLVRNIISEIQRELRCSRLTVVATGGDASWLARRVPEIDHVKSDLTLEGLRLHWGFNQAASFNETKGRFLTLEGSPTSLRSLKTEH